MNSDMIRGNVTSKLEDLALNRMNVGEIFDRNNIPHELNLLGSLNRRILTPSIRNKMLFEIRTDYANVVKHLLNTEPLLFKKEAAFALSNILNQQLEEENYTTGLVETNFLSHTCEKIGFKNISKETGILSAPLRNFYDKQNWKALKTYSPTDIIYHLDEVEVKIFVEKECLAPIEPTSKKTAKSKERMPALKVGKKIIKIHPYVYADARRDYNISFATFITDPANLSRIMNQGEYLGNPFRGSGKESLRIEHKNNTYYVEINNSNVISLGVRHLRP